MQTSEELQEAFAIPGCLAFDEPHPGMPRVRVTTPQCTGELYLQGAHVTQWQPAGQSPVLFLSERSAFTPGKAIRGGIPVICPWFGSPETTPVPVSKGSASHGFARVWPWTLRFAALAGDDLHLSLTLDHNERLHAMGFDFLQLGLDVIFGQDLTVRLSVANMAESGSTLVEEALHAYLELDDVQQASVEGLTHTEYLDKTEGFRRKTEEDAAVHFQGETDRPYLNTEVPVTLVDPIRQRRLVISKTHSRSTVVWNPAAKLAAQLPDLDPGDWQHFACVETANVADNVLHLKAREAHTMAMQLHVEPL